MKPLLKLFALTLCIAFYGSGNLSAHEISGVWLNEKNTGGSRIISGLTRIIVSGNGQQIKVYEKCRPHDCDWGEATLGEVRPIQGAAHYRASFGSSKQKKQLQLYRKGSNRLQVKLIAAGKTVSYYFRKHVVRPEDLNAEYYRPGTARNVQKKDVLLPQLGLVKGVEVASFDDDTHVIQGDILIDSDNMNLTRYIKKDDDLMTLQQSLASNLVLLDDWKWEYGVIPFDYHSTIASNEDIIDNIEQAVEMINDNTLLRVVRRSGQKDYVRFGYERGTCSSYIGRKGGMQEIKISEDCSVGNIVHELLHAAGFHHEQSRADRDLFVRIDYLNIEWGKEHNFFKSALNAHTPYDYGSIMHYADDAFIDRPGVKSIIPLFPAENMGQRDELSRLDIAGINRVYGRDKWYISSGGSMGWEAINSSKVGSNLILADFGGNGKADVLHIKGTVWQISKDGTTEWRRHNLSRVSRSDLGVGDFDGDGKADIFYANGNIWQVSYGGNNSWKYLNKSAIRSGQLRFGDFNGDGKTDVFFANGSVWKISYGGRGGWQTVNDSGISVDQLKFGDFNGDGKTDVFYANGREWKVSYSARESWKRINKSSIESQKLSVGDFNGDGRDDIFYGNGKVWKVSFSGTSGWRVIGVSSFANSDLHFADVNGDGKTDVFSAR